MNNFNHCMITLLHCIVVSLTNGLYFYGADDAGVGSCHLFVVFRLNHILNEFDNYINDEQNCQHVHCLWSETTVCVVY